MNAQAKTPLWGDLDIPIIVGTGEFGQGKTIFGLMICPGPQTLVFDNEGSSLTYRSLGFEHVDMATELMKKYPNGFTAQQRYEWWLEQVITRGKTGKYRVCMVDPVSEIEDGIAEKVRKQPEAFGLTKGQIEKSSGLLWGAMKTEWKSVLDRIRTYYETVYLVVHMRDEYRGNSPTGRREPKGKETLMQLSSLFLEFEREKDKKGNVAAVPSANVHKTRLTRFIDVDGELTPVPVTPPRIPVCTPKAIREYITTPPDYAHLKAGERVQEKSLSDDDKLRLQAMITNNQAETSKAELAMLERKQVGIAAQSQAHATATAQPDMACAYAESATEKAVDRAADAAVADQTPAGDASSSENSRAAAMNATASEKIVNEIKALLPQAFAGDSWKAWLTEQLKKLGRAKVTMLTQSQAEDLQIDLLKQVSAYKQKAAADKLASGSGEPGTLSQAPTSKAFDEEALSTITKDQLLRIKDLSERTSWKHDAQAAWLKERGLANFRGLSYRMAEDRIEEMLKVELGFTKSDAPPGN